MIGNNSNKQSGQVLLIVVMLVAVIITIVLTVTFTSQTETKITKLEEENQKALAAAEAGIEASLQQGADIANLSTVGNLGNTISSGAVTSSALSGSSYAPATVTKDDAYTFYLKNYPGFGTPSPANDNQAVTLCFGTPGGGTQPSLDITLIKDPAATPNTFRYVADPAGIITGTGELSTSACSDATYGYSVTIPAADISNNSRLLVVRVLNTSSKLLVSQANLPSQGKALISVATSKTGVKKRIQLTQSYPQIPSDFFSTSF